MNDSSYVHIEHSTYPILKPQKGQKPTHGRPDCGLKLKFVWYLRAHLDNKKLPCIRKFDVRDRDNGLACRI